MTINIVIRCLDIANAVKSVFVMKNPEESTPLQAVLTSYKFTTQTYDTWNSEADMKLFKRNTYSYNGVNNITSPKTSNTL